MLEVSSATQRPKGMRADDGAGQRPCAGDDRQLPEHEGRGHPAPRGPLDDLSDPSASLSTPMISHRPTRLPMTISRLGQLIRFASTSLGTSTPAAVASDSRNVRTNPFCVRAMRSVSASSVERCRWVSTVWIVSMSSTRQYRGDRALDADDHANRGHGGGDVAVGARRGRRRRGPPEVAYQRSLGGRHHGRGAQRAVRDPRTAQGEHGTQVVVHHVVAEVLSRQLAKRGPGAAASPVRRLGSGRTALRQPLRAPGRPRGRPGR